MKSDEEFLNGMWQKVSALEREELEKARIKSLNRRLTKKAINIASISILVFIVLITLCKYINEAIYPITIGILFISFIYESISNKILEDKTYAN